MRGVVGKTLRRRVSFPISAAEIRNWAIAVYFPDAPPERYRGGGAAAGGQPLAAPEEFNPFAWSTPGREPRNAGIDAGFLERQAGVTPPVVEFILNGGTVCAYGVSMIEGDVITATYSLKSYAQKQGKRGPLLITETQDLWTNQRGEMVRDAVMTLVRY
jgi:hypothetical protein